MPKTMTKTAEPMTDAERLDLLERKNRRLWALVVVTLWVGIACAAAIAVFGLARRGPFERNQFHLVDESGRQNPSR